MNILFLIIPVAILGATMVSRLVAAKRFSVPSLSSDERGVTLETVIVTAVLALAAAGAGVIIYNVVKDNSNDVSANARSSCTAGNIDQAALKVLNCDGTVQP